MSACYGEALDKITLWWNSIIEYAFPIFFSVIFLYIPEIKITDNVFEKSTSVK